jgi:hypothetical protein
VIRKPADPGHREERSGNTPCEERGKLMPLQKPSSLMTCPCGQMFDNHRLEDTVIHVPHITASAIQ